MVNYSEKKKKDRLNNPRKEIEIGMITGYHLSKEILEWFQFHFPQSSTFDGFFQICYRGALGFRTLWTGLQDNVEEFLSKMKILNGSDYYIAPNCCTSTKRNKEHLFAMQNIVIDIDCHDEQIKKEERQERLKKFRGHFEEYTQFLPLPHSIVSTGRGLQLWWAIEPIHAKCLYFYNQVKEYFIHCLEHILKKNGLHGLTVDHTASNNAVGVFRLPGTNNPKARLKVRLERTSVKEPYILQDLEEIAKKHHKKLQSQPNFYNKIAAKTAATKQGKVLLTGMEEIERFVATCKEDDLEIIHGGKSFTYFRTKQLIHLLTLRNKPKGAEERNNFSLLIYSALRASFSHEESWNRLQRFNQKFKKPLTLRELENVISTAQYKEGYRFSNEKVIDFLHITPLEREEIGLYSMDDPMAIDAKNGAYQRHLNKVKKEIRNNKVIDLFSQGKTTQEIAETLEISVATVNRITISLRQATKQQLLQEIRGQLDTGISFSAIVKNSAFLSNAPKGSVYSYRNQALALSC